MQAQSSFLEGTFGRMFFIIFRRDSADFFLRIIDVSRDELNNAPVSNDVDDSDDDCEVSMSLMN